jgi:hypothetical protein
MQAQHFQKLKVATAALTKICRWEAEHLPAITSSLAFELMLVACSHHALHVQLPLKVLILHLPHYSPQGIRKALMRCELDGLLVLKRSREDARVQLVTVTPKLVLLIQSYFEFIKRDVAGKGQPRRA